MKMIKIYLSVLILGFYACNQKTSPAKHTIEKQKVEIMAYYKSSGKLGYLVESVKLVEDQLIFNIVYNGGCKPHTFKLIADSSVSSTTPIQTNLFLVHENNGDNCVDEIKKELVFDIKRLKNLGFNPIQLNIDNLNTISYQYK